MIKIEVLHQIIDSFQLWIDEWKRETPVEDRWNEALFNLVYELHGLNYLLWNEEDKVRRTDLDNSTIVGIKRGIDQLNQRRNDSIERIDSWLLEHHYNHLLNHDLPARTETPGNALDRLSVLSLKIYSMRSQTKRTDIGKEHIETCRGKLDILSRQLQDLKAGLADMILELNAGRIRMNVYRQFKMYNDANLNPQLYTAKDVKEER